MVGTRLRAKFRHRTMRCLGGDRLQTLKYLVDSFICTNAHDKQKHFGCTLTLLVMSNISGVRIPGWTSLPTLRAYRLASHFHGLMASLPLSVSPTEMDAKFCPGIEI